MIAEKDYLEIEYKVNYSIFGGKTTSKEPKFSQNQRIKRNSIAIKYREIYKYIPSGMNYEKLAFLVEIIDDTKLNKIYKRDMMYDTSDLGFGFGCFKRRHLSIGKETKIEEMTIRGICMTICSESDSFYKRLSDILRHEIEKTNDNRILDLYNLKYEM